MKPNKQIKLDRTKHVIRGGQLFLNNMRMLFQVNKMIGKIYVLSALLLTITVFWVMTPYQIVTSTWTYWKACLFNFMGNSTHVISFTFQGNLIEQTAKTIMNDPYFIQCHHDFMSYFWGECDRLLM